MTCNTTESDITQRSRIIDLPHDILRYNIFNDLVDDPTFLSLSFVSKYLHNLCSNMGVELKLDKKVR